MEPYLLSKTIENHKIDIQFLLHQLKDARDILLQSMKKRKDMAIQLNESNFNEEDANGLFENENPSECDVVIIDLIEKNNTLEEEVQISKGNKRCKQSDSMKRRRKERKL